MTTLIFFLVILFSPWSGKILSFNFLIFLVLIGASYLLLQKIDKKIKWPVLIGIFSILVFFQFQTTKPANLTSLTEVEKTVQIMRMREYPSARLAHIVEERKESIAFFRIQKNLFENLDLNLYFFGNHPRSRVGYDEFEKFWFVLLPFFVIGLIYLIKEKKYLELSFVFFVPLILLSLIGNNNLLGPFSLFPFFVVVITRGIAYVFTKKP